MLLNGRIDAQSALEVYQEDYSNAFGAQAEFILSDPVRCRAVERLCFTNPEFYEAMHQTGAYLGDRLESILLEAKVKHGIVEFQESSNILPMQEQGLCSECTIVA